MNPPNGKEFCKQLEQHGWVLRRIESSHTFMAKMDRRLEFLFPFTAPVR
jgi:predicted RNA binding protein YcfA (HicA-like mRNA interferase family)